MKRVVHGVEGSGVALPQAGDELKLQIPVHQST